MPTALLLAAGSALLGGALALLARRRPALLELTRTFAFAAAGGVVALHLLPDVLRESGPPGLLWALAGFLLPGILEWLARALGPRLRDRGMSPERVAAEVGFAALAVHSVLEGLALRAAVAKGSGADLEIALVAHHAPLTAAVALPLLELLGPRATLLRVLGVAVAGAAGALAGPGADTASRAAEGGLLSIAGAAMAGALLHVVVDEIRPQHLSGTGARAADLAVAALGLLVAGLGGWLHPELGSSRDSLGVLVTETLELTSAGLLALAPALLLGDLLAVALRRRLPPAWRLDDLPGASPATQLAVLSLLGPRFLAGRLLVLGSVFSAWRLLGSRAGRGGPGPAGRPPLPGPRSPWSLLLEQSAIAWPRRLAVLVCGCATLVLIESSRADPAAAGSALEGVAVLAAGSGLSGAATMYLALIALGLRGPPELFLGATTLPPLLARIFRRGVDGGVGAGRAGAATAVLLVGGLAAWALAPGFLPSPEAAAFRLAAIAGPDLRRQWTGTPWRTLATLAALVVAVIPLWQRGVRGWLAPLRHSFAVHAAEALERGSPP